MDVNALLAATDELPPFPASYPQLSRVDRAVLCPICKELFKGPVSIACGHSFCSAVSCEARLGHLTNPPVYSFVPRHAEEVSYLS